MKKAILTLLLCNLALFAADVTGTWSGTLVAKNDDGSDRNDTAYLLLKQEGSTITGTVGGNPDDQRPLQNGKVEGDQVTFEATNNNGNVYKIVLKLQKDGNTLTGQIQRQRNGETQTAQLEVKRK